MVFLIPYEYTEPVYPQTQQPICHKRAYNGSMKKYAGIREDLEFIAKGYVVIGIDEVGRGCLAGPVYAAAICLSDNESGMRLFARKKPRIADSKAMTPRGREKICPVLMREAVAYGIGSSPVEDINNLGIVKATANAMITAVSQVLSKVGERKAVLMVDGLRVAALDGIQGCVQYSYVKGDAKIISIAAASIVAKVHRDMYMMGLHNKINRYDWGLNKGYGTASHRKAILAHGPSEHHRELFIRNIFRAQ